MNKWSISDAFFDRLAFATVLILCGFWSIVLQYKYAFFGYYDWDLAMYNHVMWNLMHGTTVSTVFGTSFLTNHAEYIAILLTPLYWIFPHALTLIHLKIFALFTAAGILYRIARGQLGPAVAFGLMLVYCFYPPNIFMLLYEFHFENLALPFLFSAIYYFFVRRKLFLFTVSILFAALVKENIALLIACFGLYALFQTRESKILWVGLPLLIGGGIFAFSMFFFVPYLRHNLGFMTANAYTSFYQIPALGSNHHFGWAYGAIIRAHLTRLFSAAFFNYFLELDSPLLFLSFLSPDKLFLGLPIFLQHLLSGEPRMRSIFYHYAATSGVYIFCAAVYGLAAIRPRVQDWFYRLIIGLILLMSFLNASLWFHSDRFAARTRWEDHFDPVRWQLVKKIPRDAGVTASFDFLAELSLRKNLYSFHTIWMGGNAFSGQTPQDVVTGSRWALIDFNCVWLREELAKADAAARRSVARRMTRFFEMADWRVEAAADNLVLFRKDGSGTKLVEVLPVPGYRTNQSRVWVREIFSLSGVNFKADPAGRCLELVWDAQKSTDSVYRMSLGFSQNGTVIFNQKKIIGYGVYATNLWQKGERIKEKIWLFIPPEMSPGSYNIVASIYQDNETAPVVLKGLDRNGKPVRGKMIVLGRIHIP
ncbi:MAG: DUF2079 domain-containing protein [Candidatus Omnitrophica bacterium]|nr:DUF2079 domain-containing protein [Candidatus Omnitrophota bacterium]